MGENVTEKDLVLLHGAIKSPPMSAQGRREMGYWLGQAQGDAILSMPRSRPMPGIGRHCHELRVNDDGQQWRAIYRIDANAIVVADVFLKKTQQTPEHIKDACQKRYAEYDRRLKRI